MQLDTTRIAIRERGYLELLDLALQVIRAFAAPLATAFVVGVAPMMAFNAWLLAGYAEPPLDEPVSVSYIFFMLVLISIEAPIAFAPTTLYLGAAVFQEHPRPGRIARDFFASLPQLIVFKVLLGWLYAMFCWHYLSHVILLERTPMAADDPRARTTVRRGSDLHRNEWGELFGRSVFSVLIGSLLFFSIWLSIWALQGVLVNDFDWDNSMITIYYPLTLWTVLGFFNIVRFLSYLDLRIRREGWEVELMMRAEADRLTRELR